MEPKTKGLSQKAAPLQFLQFLFQIGFHRPVAAAVEAVELQALLLEARHGLGPEVPADHHVQHRLAELLQPLFAAARIQAQQLALADLLALQAVDPEGVALLKIRQLRLPVVRYGDEGQPVAPMKFHASNHLSPAEYHKTGQMASRIRAGFGKRGP